jgi:hypothetical protein
LSSRTVSFTPSGTDLEGKFTCADDATGVQQFIAPIGSERNRKAWVAYSDGGFIAKGSKQVMQFPMMLPSYILGSQATVKATGGDYSVGLACLKDNSVNFAASGLWFTKITVTPGTGEWVAAANVVAPEPVDPTLTGEIGLEATTVTAPEGVLSLSVPTGTTAKIGTPTLVDGLSTSTGTLGQVIVTDGRVQTKAGWTLTATVADFVGAGEGNTISAAQLGVAPKVVTTTASGVTAAAAQVAGSGKYPSTFASATKDTAVGTTTLDADLKFVAPANKIAGVYTSKLTLTLASN